MMASSRSLPGSDSWLRMAANIPFQPLAKFGLCRSMRSRLSSLPPALRDLMAVTRSGGPTCSSERYGIPDFETFFAPFDASSARAGAGNIAAIATAAAASLDCLANVMVSSSRAARGGPPASRGL